MNPGVYALVAALVLAAGGVASGAPAPEAKVIASLDLSKPFDTRTPWRFTATQGPATGDDTPTGDSEPGLVTLCLQHASGAACDQSLQEAAHQGAGSGLFDDPHYLNAALVVHPKGPSSPPLLWVQVASVHSGDGGQLVHTQVLAYRSAADRFARVFDFATGTNNNEIVRLIDTGPLAGDIVTAEPTSNAPYVYWVTINRLTAAYTYAQVLRYRSATHYGDGNRLSVVDSEMPNIEQRLGVWRLGQPLPLPASGCPAPRLSHMELWCGPPM